MLGASRSSAEQPCTPLDNCAGQIDLHPALSDRDERKDGIGHAAPACWTLSACSQRQNWAHRLRHSRSDRLLQLFLCGQASSNSSTPKTTVRRTDSVADEAGSGRRPLRPCVSQPVLLSLTAGPVTRAYRLTTATPFVPQPVRIVTHHNGAVGTSRPNIRLRVDLLISASC